MFVTLEGIEGAGKSTMLGLLSAWLENSGRPTLVTREPGGSRLGRRLRSLLLDCRQESLSPLAELYLFLADRAQHISEVIQPALEAGQVVLCDRYADSTIAYQGYGRGMPLAELREACGMAARNLPPDLTLLLDLPPHAGLARAGARNRESGTVISEGRFDAESLDFHERVRRGYLELAAQAPGRITVIDAARERDAVLHDCMAAIAARLERAAGLGGDSA